MKFYPLRKNMLVTLIAFIVFSMLNSKTMAAAPDISADAAILLDVNTGETLYEKNADKREYPASLTKIMTAILAIENGHMDRIVEISPNAADVESTRLRGGEHIRLLDLVYQMMLISDNGCATAVGESLTGGDVDYFAQLMNRRAAEMGTNSTHFVNANGMPDSSHYTTARDMGIIARYALKNDEFRKIIGTAAKNIYYIKPQGRVEYCVNTNELLTNYVGCIGGKTGWTSAARGCLMVAASRNGRELLAIVLHSNDDETRFSESAALLDYGFSLSDVK